MAPGIPMEGYGDNKEPHEGGKKDLLLRAVYAMVTGKLVRQKTGVSLFRTGRGCPRAQVCSHFPYTERVFK